MKTAKLLFLSVFSVALTGCVINIKVQRADLSLQENLSLSAKQLTHFDIEAGAGFLVLTGDNSATEISVQADIRTTEAKNYTLELERSGNSAKLVAKHHSHSGYWEGSSPSIDLTITMPANLTLNIDDGSGDIKVSKLKNAFVLEDGTGSVSINDITGDVIIDDGSGDLTITNVVGNIEIDDGSGNLTIREVTGKVTIDDGSGDIDVNRVGSLKIIDSGSGGLSISKVEGEVDIDS